MGNDFQSLPRSSATVWSNINVVSGYATGMQHISTLAPPKLDINDFYFNFQKHCRISWGKVAKNKVTIICTPMEPIGLTKNLIYVGGGEKIGAISANFQQ